LHAGWVLFGIACLNNARLPVETLLIGPAMMVAGVAMIERNKRELPGQPGGGSADTASQPKVR